MMPWPSSLLEVLDFRSFSSIWYWVLLLGVWQLAQRRSLGVSAGLLERAQRGDLGALADLEATVALNLRDYGSVKGQETGDTSLIILCGLTGFSLSCLLLLGFAYQLETAQAVSLLLLPLFAGEGLGLLTAWRLQQRRFTAAELVGVLQKLRLQRQGLAMIGIFVSALWGMAFNFAHRAL